MINLQVLNNIKLSETDHELNILVINENLNISIEDQLALKSFGKITIAVNTPIEASCLISKFSGLNYSIVLTRRIPIRNYDILISNCFSEITRVIVKNLRIKYLCFTNFVRNFNLINYYEFEENSYKLAVEQMPYKPVPHPPHPPIPPHSPSQREIPTTPPGPPPINPMNEDDDPTNDVTVGENDESNYNAIIKDLSSTEVTYDKYKLNYLHPVVPGKISIIMVVSQQNNNFAEVLRDLRAQDLPSIEFIIIDNASNYRNNVKPNIRYGEKMPDDYCMYHAKELTTGEYIIALNQDSETFDIMTAINQGKYETR